MSKKAWGFMFPALFIIAWFFALTSTSSAPGASTGGVTELAYLQWLIYFAGYVFVVSAIMHSVFAKHTAASIGWKTNGFQYEIAFVSLGLGVACFYAVNHGLEAMTAISIPIITFLFLAGLNHLREIITKKNYAPNNTAVLIWDFGMPISLAWLLLAVH